MKLEIYAVLLESTPHSFELRIPLYVKLASFHMCTTFRSDSCACVRAKWLGAMLIFFSPRAD